MKFKGFLILLLVPDAKRVLVLVTDKRSDSSLEDVETSAEALWSSRIKVVPVAFGREAAPDEVKATTSDEDNLIGPLRTLTILMTWLRTLWRKF